MQPKTLDPKPSTSYTIRNCQLEKLSTLFSVHGQYMIEHKFEKEFSGTSESTLYNAISFYLSHFLKLILRNYLPKGCSFNLQKSKDINKFLTILSMLNILT